MRRSEFEDNRPELVEELLSTCKIGHLAFEREGEIELLPFNFVFHRGRIFFHGAPQSGLAAAKGTKVKFLTYNSVAWIPSTWRHPSLACPATTYFQSLSMTGVLTEVIDLEEKAAALETFMDKYQDEPWKPLTDKAYHGPLKALFVASIAVENPVVKYKTGQNLTPKQRETVYRKLRERSRGGDRQVAQAMLEVDQELSDSGWVESLNRSQTESVARLLTGTYWALGRTVAEQRELNERSQIVLAKCEGNEILAFCRVNLMSPKNAFLSDVVVAPRLRGKGLGTELMRRLLSHPKIQTVNRLMLFTRDREHFYGRFGFQEKYRTDSVYMVLTRSED